jgi:hypothetical protein
MGWAVGEGKDGRDIGYGVPALCDHPDCNERIDRGLSFVCGMINTDGEDRGCGLHFCENHLRCSDRFGQLCFRCWPRKKTPFVRKPDLPEWNMHKLTDETWQQWRDEHPFGVARLQQDSMAVKPAQNG